MNFMSILSTIISALCGAWLLGLLVFVIIKKIKIRRKAKKEIKDLTDGKKEIK